MATHWIKLDPDNDEDRTRLHMLEHGWKYRSVVRELDNFLRNEHKHVDRPKRVTRGRYAWNVRKVIKEFLEDHSLDPLMENEDI